MHIKSKETFASFLAGLAISIFIVTPVILNLFNILYPKECESLAGQSQNEFQKKLDTLFPERLQIVKELPYKTVPAEIPVHAQSAILIDAQTGNILYKKNADELIPPASMTKLVEMYVVLDATEKGKISLDDKVPLPPQSWAINLPRDASIMFLAQGQQVTLRELLLGLSIASGNDASIAVANYVAGNMEDFVMQMNSTVNELGLKNTKFVESSGYSEKNITTAKEFAAFCKVYIERFPFAINDFHSQKVLRYPLEHNLPQSQRAQGDGQAVVQYNTNKLLGKLEGCDGLKTGFIYESGYNIALTAKRGKRRFISVTMRGPGTCSAEGNKYRNEDGTALMEFAFRKFAPYTDSEERKYSVPVLGSKVNSVNLVPAEDASFSVPFITGTDAEDCAKKVRTEINIPSYIYGQVQQGAPYGQIVYKIDDTLLKSVPLVADRDSSRRFSLWSVAAKTIAEFIL